MQVVEPREIFVVPTGIGAVVLRDRKVAHRRVCTERIAALRSLADALERGRIPAFIPSPPMSAKADAAVVVSIADMVADYCVRLMHKRAIRLLRDAVNDMATVAIMDAPGGLEELGVAKRYGTDHNGDTWVEFAP